MPSGFLVDVSSVVLEGWIWGGIATVDEERVVAHFVYGNKCAQILFLTRSPQNDSYNQTQKRRVIGRCGETSSHTSLYK